MKLQNKNKIAIISNEANISYRKLNEIINQLSFFIKKESHNKKIIITGDIPFLKKIIILSCLKVNCTYIPLHESTPINKIKKISKIVNCKTIINCSKDNVNIKNSNVINLINFKSLKKNFNKKNPKKFKNKISYIIFTSGSSGDPKGVIISRKSLMSYLKFSAKNSILDKNDHIMQFSDLGFDLSVVDFLLPLYMGATITSLESQYEKLNCIKKIDENNINTIVCVPSLINIIMQNNKSKQILKKIKKIFFCGEPLKKSHLQYLFKYNKNIKVENTYGPTEFTVSCSSIKLNIRNYLNFIRHNYISIGQPINKTSFKIQNEKGSLNNIGELYLSGKQMFNGYINKDTSTDMSILKIKRKKYYKTGDIVEKYNLNYYFIKRNDNQVKILGHRINLEEIDKILKSKYGTIKDCKSFYLRKKIFTFILLDKKINNLKVAIKKTLAKNLNVYMQPQKIVVLKFTNFLLNRNYKVDWNKILKLNQNIIKNYSS